MSAIAKHEVSAQDLNALRLNLRSALADVAPLRTTAELVSDGPHWDREVWRRLASELFLPAIAIPEMYGGQGFGRLEEAVVLEELGRVLYSGPYLASAALAARTLLESRDDAACHRLLPGIARGETIAALIDGSASVEATRGGDGRWVVDGDVQVVVSAQDAVLFVVIASSAEGPVLLTFPAEATGVVVKPLPVMDFTRGLASVQLTGVVGDVLGHPGSSTADAVHRVRNAALSALAAEQVGAASGILDITVEYAKSRVQFGREIGTFQAVRHRLADLYAEVEMASAAVRHAAQLTELGNAEADVTVAVAASFCAEAFVRTAEEAMQLHGGIGFTWEHPAHLFLKRAKSSELLLGSPAKHRLRIYDEMFESKERAE